MWSKATEYDISNYVNILNDNLNYIHISEDLFSCDNCNSIEHRDAIDNLCDSVITSCINASVNCSPTTRSRASNVTGWTERERSLLWYWIWLDESGIPNKGFIYEIVKSTRHRYHYAVRCCKRNKLHIQKQKLADNVSNNK